MISRNCDLHRVLVCYSVDALIAWLRNPQNSVVKSGLSHNIDVKEITPSQTTEQDRCCLLICAWERNAKWAQR